VYVIFVTNNVGGSYAIVLNQFDKGIKLLNKVVAKETDEKHTTTYGVFFTLGVLYYDKLNEDRGKYSALVCVCVCVCGWVCVCVCVCGWMGVCVYVYWVYVCVCVCMWVYVLHIYVCGYVCVCCCVVSANIGLCVLGYVYVLCVCIGVYVLHGVLV